MPSDSNGHLLFSPSDGSLLTALGDELYIPGDRIIINV